MRKSIAEVSRSPKWVLTLVMLVGVMTLMALGVVDAKEGMIFLGGQAAGFGSGALR